VAASGSLVVPNKITGTAAGEPYRNYVSSVSGNVLGEFDMMSPGSLPVKRAETFSGGRYAEIELNESLVVYRGWSPGTWAAEDGAFWSLEKLLGSLQTKIDSALLPEWGAGNAKAGFNSGLRSQATNWTAIELPKGSRIYLGEIGGQNGSWVGGGSQLLIKGGPNLGWKIDGGLLK
jgi:hypothetical protein